MNVIEISEYDPAVFEELVELKNKIHQDIETSFPEKVEDLKNLFFDDQWLKENYRWRFILVKKENKLVGRGAITWKHGDDIAALGFLEWENDSSVLELIVNSASRIAINHNIKKIKAPVDFHFFVKYRWVTKKGEAPFYGEPIVPDYYPLHLEMFGFAKKAGWDTYIIDLVKVLDHYKHVRQKIKKKYDGDFSKLTIRHLNLLNWDKELHIVHSLLLTSFKDMSEFAEMPFESFKKLYEDFKHLVHPLYTFFVMYEGEEVGFSIAFFDPQDILAPLKNKKIGLAQKILTLVKMRLNHKRLLIMYLGKVPTKDGREIKGVQSMVAKRLTILRKILPNKQTLICYLSKDSPAKNSFRPEFLVPYSEYTLWEKDLE